MGSIAAISIINNAKVITQDIRNVAWPKEETLTWLNAGQLDIAMHRPDVCSVLVEHTTVRGPTQQIPSDGLMFLEANYNIESGYSITEMEGMDIDLLQRNWQRLDNDADEVEHYIYDPRFPKYFKLYPSPAANVKIQIGYTKAPEKITLNAFDGSDLTPISIDDTYSNALMYFVLAMLFQKQTRVTNATQLVNQYYQLYFQSLNIKFDADKFVSPTNPEMKGK